MYLLQLILYFSVKMIAIIMVNATTTQGNVIAIMDGGSRTIVLRKNVLLFAKIKE